MYRIVRIEDKESNLNEAKMKELQEAHPSMEGEILNADLLKENQFIGRFHFKWNDNSGKILSTSWIVDYKMSDRQMVITTLNSVYILEELVDEQQDLSDVISEYGDWIKCIEGQMPEDFKCYQGRKIIDVIVTTASGHVTKVQRKQYRDAWCWGRIYGQPKAWMPLPQPYKE